MGTEFEVKQSKADPGGLPRSTPLANLAGVLLDLDGVLYVGNQVVVGAIEALELIRRADIPLRFITNTSTQSRQSLLRKLVTLGFTAHERELFSAPQAAVRYLRQFPHGTCHLLLEPDVRRDFTEFRQVALNEADVIILGDIGEAWTYELLNSVFNRLVAGARLVVIHRNRFWQTESGLKMDIGGFVAALEYCSGAKATVIGKPSEEFFRLVLEDLGQTPASVMVVGDDIESDVGGGQQAGLRGVLVRTGKYREAQVAASPVKPDYVIDSIQDLPALLGIV
jgi:HAD superfamily hydrolase (TIGR01458 family)